MNMKGMKYMENEIIIKSPYVKIRGLGIVWI